MATLHPLLKWAQRPENVLISCAAADATNVEISVADSTLVLSYQCGDKKFACTHKLFAEIDADASTNRATPRAIELKLIKKEASDEYWPRLTEKKGKHQHITIDWDMWKDPEEVAEGDAGEFGAGGPPGMGGMGGMPGMGGMGGMPGMGGMGGMGGMPGMGGMGGMDMNAMMAGLGGMGGGAGGMPDFANMPGMPGGAGEEDEEGAAAGDEEDEMPPLE